MCGRHEASVDEDDIAIEGFERREDPITAATFGDCLYQGFAIVAIAPLHDDVEIFAVGRIDLRPSFWSRRSDGRRMDAPLDSFDQIALPREAMQLPDAEADQHCKASQRGNDDCRYSDQGAAA